MFIYDKDMERVMLAKKKEVLAELETAKKRILKELYCVKRGVHTDMCGMIADYNRIKHDIDKTLEDVTASAKATLDDLRNILADDLTAKSEEFDRMTETQREQFNEYVEEISAALTAVENLKAEFQAIIDSKGQGDWNEEDTTSPSHILNRTHYGEFEEVSLIEDAYIVDMERMVNTQRIYKLPITLTELNTLDVMNVNIRERSGFKEYKLSPVYRDLILYRYTMEGSSVITNLEIVKNILTFGDTGDETNVYKGSASVPTTFFIYVDPVDNATYISLSTYAQHFYFDDRNSSPVISITVTRATNIKRLNEHFIGVGGALGSVPTLTGNGVEWILPPITKYSTLTVNCALECHLTMTPNSQNFTGTIDPDFLFDTSKYYYLDLGKGLQPRRIAEQNGKYYSLFSGGFTFTIGANGAVTGRASNSQSENFPDDYKTNGMTAKFYVYENVEHIGKLSPDFITGKPATGNHIVYDGETLTWSNDVFILSPNGTKYALTVSDDGTLSATPVTE